MPLGFRGMGGEKWDGKLDLNGKQTSEDFRGFPEILETCAELSFGEIQPTFSRICSATNSSDSTCKRQVNFPQR